LEFTNTNYYEVNFAGPLYVPSERNPIIESSKFIHNGFISYFLDEIGEFNGIRNVYLYSNQNGSIVKGNDPIGQLNPREGKLIFNNFFLSDLRGVKINALPNSYNIAPLRNQLIDIDLTQLTIDGEIDTIATSGSSRAENYNTTPRFR
jgi:hypothetical protein